MLIGAATPYAKGTDYTALDIAAGPFSCRRSYHGDKDGFPLFANSNAAMDYDAATGQTEYVSVLSFKPNVHDMASGALDASVLAFLHSVPVGHKMILSIWHEADGKARAAKPLFTVAEFKAAFVRFCTLVHQVNNPNLYTALILEAYQPKTVNTSYADMWPGRGFADLLLVDGYTDLGNGGSVWDKAITFAYSVGIPWGIAEIGTRGGEVDPMWMAEQVAYAKTYDARVLCWFNTSTGNVLPTPGTDVLARQAAETISILEYEDPTEFVPWRRLNLG